ncbi:MAG: zinc-binding dehydrogenase [SAR202 cluster bacterium]|nr:zinc-binding dehydrogenase [SAR202 cluster bacterium]|tara:strand:+ start:2738 stop:3703 length:966 start_codon:yes stop_codon:yes gene_type:complete
MKAVRLNEFGGVDVLKVEDVPEPTPRPHHVLIKVDSAGVNYADILRRGGNYPGPGLPSSMGLEAAGTVMEVGSDVTEISVGQKVMGMGPGGQAEYVAINGNLVFPYPDSLDPVVAGGMPIVFLTSYHILTSRGNMQSGDTVLVQAGASGVGTVLIQLAKAWGAKVIATASTQDKLDLCKSLGADITINYTETDFEEVVNEETGGNGVELVAECVGGETLEKSVRCVASYGRLVSYGNASQTPANIPASDFTTANRSIIGFSIGRSPVGSLDHKGAMAELFPLIEQDKAKLIVDQILPLSDVAKAHEHLASRGARGKVILTP